MHDYIARTVSPEDLAKLKADREAADARYNAALTAVDRAVQRVPDLPHPPPGPDEHQVTPLNQSWQILGGVPALPGGAAGRPLRLARARAGARRAAAVQLGGRRPRQPQHPARAGGAAGHRRDHRPGQGAARSGDPVPVGADRLPADGDAVCRHQGLRVRRAGTARRRGRGQQRRPARRGDARLRRRLERAVRRGPEALRGAHRRRSAPRPGRRRAAHGRRRGAALYRGGAADPRNRRQRGARAGGAPRRPLRPRRRLPAARQQLLAQDPVRSHQYAGFEDLLPRIRGRVSANGWPTTSGGSPAPPMSSTSAAGAASSSSCCATPAFPPAASTSTSRWSSAVTPRASTSPAATRSPTSRRCPMPAWAGSSPARWSSTSSPTTCCASSSWPRSGCGLAASSCSRPSTRRRGLRSSRATSATSPTSGRCTPIRSATCSSPTGSSRPRSCGARRRQKPPGFSTPAAAAGTGDAALDAVVRTVDRNVDRLNGLMFGPRDFAAIARRP